MLKKEKEDKRSEVLNIRLRPSDKIKIKEIARQNDKAMGEFIRDCIKEVIKKNEKN